MTKKLDKRSMLAVTEKRTIEYEKKGKGPVVICLHGGPGGYDQSSLIGEHLVSKGFTVIAKCRNAHGGRAVDQRQQWKL